MFVHRISRYKISCLSDVHLKVITILKINFNVEISMSLRLFPQDNQEREKKKHLKLKSSRDAERQMNKELVKEGKKPVFVSKAERKAKELVTNKFMLKIVQFELTRR